MAAKHEELRPVVWELMGQLERMGAGRRGNTGARETFVLKLSEPAVERLTTKPDAKNLIRSQEGGLLIRYPSSALYELLTHALPARGKSRDKGLEFLWSELEVMDLHVIFSVIAWVANSDPAAKVNAGSEN